MSDGLLKEVLLTFSAAAGVTFICWIIWLIRQNNQKDKEIVARETEVQYQILKGEIDNSSLYDVVKRANEREKRDSKKG